MSARYVVELRALVGRERTGGKEHVRFYIPSLGELVSSFRRQHDCNTIARTNGL
jgi:hypothetical protein